VTEGRETVPGDPGAGRPIEQLWAAGLALLVVAAGLLVVPLGGEARESFLWVSVGAALPAAAVAARELERSHRLPVGLAQRALGLVAVAAAALLALAGRDPAVLVLGVVQAGFVGMLARGAAGAPRAVLLGALVGWAVALPTMWWRPGPDAWLSQNLALTLLGLYLVVGKLCRSELRSRPPARWVPVAGALVALALLGYASLRTDLVSSFDAQHHWSFYVGPALLIRQGGVPLWDAPSQYGLLSELAVAWTPAGSAWQSLYLVNAALNLAYAYALFLLLRARAGDALDQVTSLLLAFLLVFGRIDAWPSAFAGPQVYPSSSGMRFAWSLVLLLVVVRAGWRAEAGRRVRRHLLAGCALWLVGCLWSFESAVYCSCTWLPAFALLAWPRHRRLLWLPPLAAAAAAALVLSLLGLRLGHPPDPRGFFEYAAAYQAGFGSEPIQAAGPVWVLVLAFAMIVAAAAGGRRVEAAALVAAGGLLWSTSSNFVSRSLPQNVENLAPIVAAGLLLPVRALSRASSTLPRQAAGAVLAAFLLGPLNFEPALREYTLTPPAPAGIEALRPHVAPALQALIDRAGIRAAEPVVYVGNEPFSALMPVWHDATGQTVAESPLWLPLAPPAQLSLLPRDRRLAYLDRFSRSWPDGGWLVEAERPDADVSWLHAWLPSHYRPARTVSAGGWRITRYRRR
jgi:hypothetical protein